jgi:hypothetical protein
LRFAVRTAWIKVVVRQRQAGRHPTEADAQGAGLNGTVRPVTQALALTVAVPLWSCTTADTTRSPSRVASVIVLWKETSTPERLATTSRQRLTASGS